KDLGSVAEPEVVKELHHPDQAVRDAVRDVLKSYGTREAVLLDQTLADLKGNDAARRKFAADWLAAPATADEKRRPEFARALDELVRGADGGAKEAALRALAVWGTKENVPALVTVTTDPGFDLTVNHNRDVAMAALGAIKDERGAEAVVKY